MQHLLILNWAARAQLPRAETETERFRRIAEERRKQRRAARSRFLRGAPARRADGDR
jgi:hypothetical protein